MKLSGCLFPLLLFLPAIGAQSVVSPAYLTSAEGNGNNSYPFGINTPTFRYVGIHDDLKGTPRVIKGMSLRRDATDLNLTPVWPAYSVTLDAWCSEAATTSTTPSSTFDNNHGNFKVQVITNKTVNFPQTEFGHVPGAFVYSMVFDSPYGFVANGPLCWEVQTTAKTNAMTIYLDAHSGSSTNPAMSITTYGAGCKVSTQSSVMSATGTGALSWPTGTGTISVNGSFGPPNSAVFLILGFSDSNFAGIPLPFLVPGSASAPSGACNLYTSIVLIVANTTNAAGSSTMTLPVPATLDLNGLRTFEQIMAFDPAANPVGIALSNSVNRNWVAPYPGTPVARVYLAGSLGPVGSVGTAYGLVIRFD